ncbi:unnamed protein product [Oppiella nova]|uniref:Uncharacterized protein n=1 Tax=Oppiella nova TaxID=334625 RepID=A0A7R9LD07_9ACAR|nr:unnamed protein product [Oppiella nova]CAG2162385.1 unnamed protein product [Oppiella nova]
MISGNHFHVLENDLKLMAKISQQHNTFGTESDLRKFDLDHHNYHINITTFTDTELHRITNTLVKIWIN